MMVGDVWWWVGGDVVAKGVRSGILILKTNELYCVIENMTQRVIFTLNTKLTVGYAFTKIG
jgi:hypothetical protein